MQLKRKWIKLASISLSAIMLLSTFAGCFDEGKMQGGTNGSSVNYYTGEGVHQANVKDRADYFVQNGASEYKLVVSENAKEYEIDGASYIQEYIYKATGALLEIVTDEDSTVSANGKFISVGDTTLMKKSGISVPFERFKNSGFKIVTKGNVVYIAGSPLSALRGGSYYGCDEFLRQMINLRVYTLEEIKYDHTSNLKMKDMDITEIPEFDARRISFRSTDKDEEYSKKVRFSIGNEGKIPLRGHSHFQILPPETYYSAHPEWYGPAGTVPNVREGQLCLSNEEMTEEFIKQVVILFQQYPDCNFIHLGIMDNQTECGCDNCLKMQKDNNTTYAGQTIIFTNKVARAVSEIIQQAEPDRKLTFQTFAYNKTFNPPVHQDKTTGKFVADSEAVIPDDNVMIQFAPAWANLSENLEESNNKKYLQALENWYLLTDNISTWCYGTNFRWLIITNKDWDVFTDNALIYSKMGVESYYLQAAFGYWVQPWEELKVFAASNIMWDVSLNYQDLAEEFIDNYYGDAAPYIQKAYDTMTTHYEYLQQELSCSGNMYFWLNDKKFWSYGYVETIRGLMQQAFEAIEPVKEIDALKYERYKERIQRLYMENLFMQLEYHISRYSKAYVESAIVEFETLASKFNVNDLSEGYQELVSKYVIKWRGAYA